MRVRAYEFRLPRVQGVPGILLLILGVFVVLGIAALVLFLGAIVAVAGLVGSVAAALYFGARRFLAHGAQRLPVEHRVENRRASPASTMQVREIEVEVLPDRKG